MDIDSGIVQIETPFKDIVRFIVERLGPAIDNKPLPLLSATFLTILIQQQGPKDLTADELIEGVRGASGYIATYLYGLRSAGLPH